jgi:hypothetical protein
MMVADRRLREALFHHDEAIGLPDRGDHRVEVHRPDGAQIDDLGVDAELGEFRLRLDQIGHADAEGDQCHVLAWLVDARLADRQHEIVELRHVEGLAVEDLVSRKITGFGSRIAALSRPLASAAV